MSELMTIGRIAIFNMMAGLNKTTLFYIEL